MKFFFLVGLLVVPTFAQAADIVRGDATAELGPDFFFDDALTGGGDNTTANFTRNLSGLWTAGAEVTLKGIAWASSAGGTAATEATMTLTDLGADGAFGTADDVVVGTVTDTLVFDGAGEYVWLFDEEIAFTAAGSTMRVAIASNGNIRRKTFTTADTSQGAVKLSLAGTAIGGAPAPVTVSATASGFWDQIAWSSASGNVTGDLGEGDSVFIGRYRTVTYRGLPADEEVGTLNFGFANAAEAGQGLLVVESGNLTVRGDLSAGRDQPANDAFVEVKGGSLQVEGNGFFGTLLDACDGSLILSGGECSFGGDLTMGRFAMGGSMLRFHNVGSSPPLAVGGQLNLYRCALDLTFDPAYFHSPGSTFTLATYASREGQFGNFREGDDFNCGPHRFRINYDVPSEGKAGIVLTALEPFATQETPPNIVFVFVDDQGFADLELNAHPVWAEKYPMPALQQIAANGVRFTDAYVSGGVCHSSRCGILSGIYQQRLGTDNNLSGPSYNGLSVAFPTVPRRLQSLGYRTYGVGKWHLGKTVEYHPNVRGFDRWYGMWAGSRSFYTSNNEEQVFQDQMTPMFSDEGNYITDRIGDKAVEFIDEHLSQHAGKPFYMYLSFTAVHAPMDILASDARYARLENEFNLTAADYLNSPRVFANSTQAAVDANRYELAAMTLALDENIQKVIDKLAAGNLTEDTIVVYANDNGGAEWAPVFGGNYSYNFPLKGRKGNGMQEGSVRVPMALQWPGKIPANQVVTTPVTTLDLMATFVQAGGAPAAVRNGLDGLDLLPLLKDQIPLPADRVISLRGGGPAGGGSALRMGDWKLFNPDPGFAPLLYNLRNDIGETTNMASANPEVFEMLKERFLAWDASTTIPLYGGGGAVLDDELERTAIVGGYRLATHSTNPRFLSGPMRSTQTMTEDWSFSFLLRSTEVDHGANAQLVYGLGSSAARADLIMAVVDYSAGEIRLVEGKSNTQAAASLAVLPIRKFEAAALVYEASSQTLTFRVGETSASLELSGDYGQGLSQFAVGVAAMEGELTSLRPGTVDFSGASLRFTNFGSDSLGLALNVAPVDGPFLPVTERSPDLSTFQADNHTLVESLGGGHYRLSVGSSTSTEREFFRLRFNQP